MDYFPNPSSSASSSVVNNSNHEKKNNGGKKSKAVKLSTDPQSVAARERRHRISDRFKILQSLVPGGTKMDTVSMLEEAIHYVKFLKTQILLHQMMNYVDTTATTTTTSSEPWESDVIIQSHATFGSNNNFVTSVQPLPPPSYPDSWFPGADPYMKY